MRYALILTGGLCACLLTAAIGQTSSAPATAPASAPATATAPATTAASQPARFKTHVEGKRVLIDVLDADFRVSVVLPELWSLREATATSSPIIYRNLLEGRAAVAWSFTVRPREKNVTADDVIKQLITRYTMRMDNFNIKDTGTLEGAEGRKFSFILYTAGGVSPEDQRYYREILVPIDEKRMLVILELCNTQDWNTARTELQGVTRSIRLEKLSKP